MKYKTTALASVSLAFALASCGSDGTTRGSIGGGVSVPKLVDIGDGTLTGTAQQLSLSAKKGTVTSAPSTVAVNVLRDSDGDAPGLHVTVEGVPYDLTVADATDTELSSADDMAAFAIKTGFCRKLALSAVFSVVALEHFS